MASFRYRGFNRGLPSRLAPKSISSRSISRSPETRDLNDNTVSDLVTTSLVAKYNQERKIVESGNERIELDNQMTENRSLSEKEYIDDLQKCPISKFRKYKDKYGAVDASNFKKLVKKNFYNAEVMKEAMCLSESIFYGPRYEAGKISPQQRARRWIDRMSKIGSGQQGTAFESDFDNSEDVFVVKVAEEGREEEMIHEFFIGLHLNAMREHVPNFAYLFGGFNCAPPVLEHRGLINNTDLTIGLDFNHKDQNIGSEEKSAVTWCTLWQKNKINYILYENIAPGVTLSKYSKTCTFEKWLDKYLQILYALHVANEKLGFTHYDLHGSNVVIRGIEDSKEVYIPYKTEKNGIEYLKTDGIATIIDYGFSYIKKDGKSYGIYGFEAYGINPNDSHPLHDAYKLLLSCMSSMNTSGNHECFDKASNILRFFDQSEKAIDIIREQSKYYYFIPYNRAIKKYNLLSLTQYIRRHVPEANDILSSRPLGSIIGCDGTNICITGDEATSMMGIGKWIEANTIFDFYDLVSRLTEEKREDDIKSVVESFDYKGKKDLATEQMSVIREDLLNIKKQMGDKIIMSELDLDFLLSPQTIESCKEYVTLLIKAYDHLQRLATMKDAVSYVSIFYDDDETLTEMEELHDKILELKPDLDDKYSQLITDMKYIQELMSEPDIEDYVEEVARELVSYINTWWWEELPQMVKAI